MNKLETCACDREMKSMCVKHESQAKEFIAEYREIVQELPEKSNQESSK